MCEELAGSKESEGKTITKICTDSFSEFVCLHFTDGSHLLMKSTEFHGRGTIDIVDGVDCDESDYERKNLGLE